MNYNKIVGRLIEQVEAGASPEAVANMAISQAPDEALGYKGKTIDEVRASLAEAGYVDVKSITGSEGYIIRYDGGEDNEIKHIFVIVIGDIVEDIISRRSTADETDLDSEMEALSRRIDPTPPQETPGEQSLEVEVPGSIPDAPEREEIIPDTVPVQQDINV